MSSRRVVVTGMGAVSCLGCGVETFWSALMSRRCGLRPLERLDASAHRIAHGGEIAGFPLDPDRDEAIQFASRAVAEAVADAALPAKAPGRTAIVLGSNFGALSSTDRFLRDPENERAGTWFREMLPHGPTQRVAEEAWIDGPRVSLSLSCCSGNAAVAVALSLLRNDEADVVIAGGYDAMTDLCWSGLAAIRTMTPDALRPFDKRRNGTIFSEGAGALALESLDRARKRGAPAHAEVLGAATDNNAYHMAHPDPEAAGMVRVLESAIANAGVSPDAIDYVSAHGTGTPYNDKYETLALKKALGERARHVPVVSIKSMVGHAMGAASALETIATIRALQSQRAPATIGLEAPDPDCDLDYVPDGPRPISARTALCNSAGIGGPNAAVVLRVPEGDS